MNPELANLALNFLSRVDLKGSEVPAFHATCLALGQIANGQARCVPAIDEPLPGETPDFVNGEVPDLQLLAKGYATPSEVEGANQDGDGAF